jgi:hypothetical protein
MNEELYFRPWWIPDPAVWRILEGVDKQAAARAQVEYYREIAAAQVKALDAAARAIGQG